MRNSLIEQKILFSNEDCNYIKNLFKDTDFKRSLVTVHNDDIYSDFRTSEEVLIDFSLDKKNIILSKLKDIGIYETPSYFSVLRYDVGQEFKKHRDNAGQQNKTNSNRFKTVVIQLSNENDYDGGELVVYYNRKEVIISKEIGNTIVFDSSLEHKVERVKKGRRYSIVFWTEKPKSGVNNTLI